MATSLPATPWAKSDQYGSEWEKNTSLTQASTSSSNVTNSGWSNEPWNPSASPANAFEAKPLGSSSSSEWSTDPANLSAAKTEVSVMLEKHPMRSMGSLAGFSDGSTANQERMNIFKRAKILEGLAVSAKAGEKVMTGAGNAVMATSEAAMDLVYQIFGIGEKKVSPPTEKQTEVKAKAAIIKQNITQQEADRARLENQKYAAFQKDSARILGGVVNEQAMADRTGVVGGEVRNISTIIFSASKEDPRKQVKQEAVVLPGSGKGKVDHNNQRGAMEDANNVMNRVG
ncbi:hypothetical protein A2631_00305 [Candidatus Daviesbacteria bacterium RIFCSPHIGHO2_01_FULL_44_29]|uniref:Uncharacterized protein n=1 Tax=Candidatus Daviesbacteria bacterium RIFCSPHIGHO2_02_FULL_43_12 TaxID=1797776 RepID=A0A1F5KFN8_9BACT|nr:MAG: hypothetical protein A2631_00305 [Candidatus Daviesbacteria bacterium RIFCSPHIGHO2_01_FULL_44_29]OGE39772.1 MAG: hypothetical protein A3D25_03535 [Candidatus Daviesbacteria bacterium RIFCSPHIGHO2_02_FULL_43_12]OGE69937.1 MAG: hypothetical protein A3B55_04550 [Candidatus Daviesbacteria bacterium RIFCSPLOWO2_01_FULL_43_15]